MVRVKYTDNIECNDSVAEYPTVEETWEAIYREIDDVAEYFNGREYRTLLFPNGAEIYAPDGHERAEWKIINESEDSDIEELWGNLADVPIDPETEELDEPYYIWPKGTDKEDIWHWFDEHHSKGVAYLLGFAD